MLAKKQNEERRFQQSDEKMEASLKRIWRKQKNSRDYFSDVFLFSSIHTN